MKALITGIRGAAGSYLAEHLRELGHEVSGIARPECDMLHPIAVLSRLDQVRPDVIYHLASKADVRAAFDTPAQCYRNNVEGTFNLFEAVRKLGIDPVIALCSSSEVYGSPDRYPITEDFPILPNNPYACSKASQDLLAQMYARCYGMRVVITRAFGYVNPRRRDLALSNFARQIAAIELNQQQELMHGNLDPIRTFCDVRDIVRAYAMTASLPCVVKVGDQLQGIYNIGSPEPISIGRCLQKLLEMARVQVIRRTDPALQRPSDATNQIPDCGRFIALTGWQPKIDIDESLAWLLDYYRAASETKNAA